MTEAGCGESRRRLPLQGDIVTFEDPDVPVPSWNERLGIVYLIVEQHPNNQALFFLVPMTVSRHGLAAAWDLVLPDDSKYGGHVLYGACGLWLTNDQLRRARHWGAYPVEAKHRRTIRQRVWALDAKSVDHRAVSPEYWYVVDAVLATVGNLKRALGIE